jgi:hypothetical protein
VKLLDLRRAAVKKQIRIRFALSNGMECVVNERGIAQIPALHAVPAFNLEDEVGRAREFLVESAAEAAAGKAKPRAYRRDELAALASAGSAEAAHDEHDE